MRTVRFACHCLAWCLVALPISTSFAFAGTDQTPITLDVTVNTHGGDAVAGLTKDDFTILDYGKPQAVTAFQSDKDNADQTEAILVLDAVNTTYDRVAFAKQQIIRYLQADGDHLAYPSTFAVVTDQGVKMQDVYTTDGNLLAQNLNKFDVGLRALGNEGGAFGATDKIAISIRAVHELLAKANAAHGRKVMIWISPGWPILNGPEASLEPQEENRIFAEITQLSYLMRGTRTVFYSIDPTGSAAAGTLRNFRYKSFLRPLRKPSGASFGNFSLQVLAISSGGIVLNADNDLTGSIQKLIQDSKPFYTLSFVPPAAKKPDEFHSIEIKLNKPGMTAQTRWGYYTRQ